MLSVVFDPFHDKNSATGLLCNMTGSQSNGIDMTTLAENFGFFSSAEISTCGVCRRFCRYPCKLSFCWGCQWNGAHSGKRSCWKLIRNPPLKDPCVWPVQRLVSQAWRPSMHVCGRSLFSSESSHRLHCFRSRHQGWKPGGMRDPLDAGMPIPQAFKRTGVG